MTHKQILLLLPDYVAGMLSHDQREFVERALQESPELRQELEHIAAVFAAFPAERVRHETEWRSRSVSVAVNEKQGVLSQRRWRWLPLAVTGAICSVVFATVMLTPVEHQQQPVSKSIAANESSVLHTPSPTTAVTPPHQLQPMPIPAHRPSNPPGRNTQRNANIAASAVAFDALALATFPDDAIDQEFVQHFVEVFTDESAH